MLRKVFLLQFFFPLVIPACLFAASDIPASKPAIETITYSISPFGSSVYQDFGIVDFRGRKANLVVFKTSAMGLDDTETIYSDPATYLPLWVEREVSVFLHEEYLTEEYFPKENRLRIIKYENNKKTEEFSFKADGPINNAILLPFSIRKLSGLAIGLNFSIRLPDKIIVKLVSVEEVTVPAGKFKAFHFTSFPNKFEIWISADKLRLPVKIKGVGGFSYTMSMAKHEIKQERQAGIN